MTWLLTATGATFDLEFAEPADIRIEDIAHHLAQLNRYTGACSRPYSVAEHSLLVYDILRWLPGELKFGPNILLAGLLHDAHEAYIADLSTPMKQVLGEAWQRAETRAQDAVLERFGVLSTFRAFSTTIKRADLQALVTERAHLLPDVGPRWPACDSHDAVHWVDWEGRARLPWTHWRDTLLERFHELQRVIAAAHERNQAP